MTKKSLIKRYKLYPDGRQEEFYVSKKKVFAEIDASLKEDKELLSILKKL